MPNYLGREEYVGVGIQSGTSAVAPQVWTRHMGNTFKPVVNKKQNESAMGRTEKVNGSTVVSKWSEGTLEGKLQVVSIGYYLASLTGGATTATNADTSGLVRDHTFPIKSSGTSTLLTIGVKNPLEDLRYPNGEVSSIELTSEAQDYVMFKVDMVASQESSATNSPAFIEGETEFTGDHVSVKLAADTASLTGATALEARSMKLTLNRPRTPYIKLGSLTSTENDTQPFEASGELVLRYKATDLKQDWNDNTTLAMQIQIKNTDVTIGDAENPTITFVAPRVTLNSFDKSNELDSYIEQTVGFYCELSEADDYAIATTLTNLQTGYAAA